MHYRGFKELELIGVVCVCEGMLFIIIFYFIRFFYLCFFFERRVVLYLTANLEFLEIC